MSDPSAYSTLLAWSGLPILVSPFVGSFLGVAIKRLPAGGILALDRSRCPHCGTMLGPRDLVPLLSWLASRGLCRYCGIEIGLFYPLIELMALTVAVCGSLMASGVDLWLDCAIGWMLLVLAWIDGEHFLLPRVLTLPLMAAGILTAAFTDTQALTDSLIGAACGYLSLRLVAATYRVLRGRDGLGLGDADLMAAAGAWLGWAMLPATIVVAASCGLIAVLVARLAGKRIDAATAIPFGPFLALAFWGLYLVSDHGYGREWGG
jgi:leader peptidase (prepilin peptidase)/N-methyltransferase